MIARVLIRAGAVWLGILFLATANGMLRESLLVALIGRTSGTMLSGIVLATLILIVAWYCGPWLQMGSRVDAVYVGLTWLLLTLAFEFGFGRVQGRTWSELLQAYTFTDGNLWPLVLVVTASAPWVTFRLRLPHARDCHSQS